MEIELLRKSTASALVPRRKVAKLSQSSGCRTRLDEFQDNKLKYRGGISKRGIASKIDVTVEYIIVIVCFLSVFSGKRG